MRQAPPSSWIRVGRMTTAGVVGLALILVAGVAHAAIQPGASLWVKHFGPSAAEAMSTAVSPDGSKVFVTGEANDRLVVAAYTTAGSRLWLRAHPQGTAGCCYDFGRSIVVSPDGESVYVTGTTSEIQGSDVLTIGFDVATGDELWAEVWDRGAMDSDEDTGSQDDYGYAIGISPDGGTVFVTGDSEYVLNDTILIEYGTLAYDTASGDLQWASYYDSGLGYDGSRSLAVSPDGNAVYVTGISAGAEANAIATVAYDSSDGDELWAEVYEGPAGQNDAGWSIAARPDGSAVFVTGGTGGTGSGTADWDIVTVAFDSSDGSVLWDRLYKGPSGGYDFGRSVAASPDGKALYVTGHSLGESGRYDITTIRYGAGSGKRLWVQRSAGPASNLGLTGDVAVSADSSRVFVASYRTKSSANDLVTISYTRDGVARWKATHDDAGIDRAVALDVNPAGTRVFVAGIGSGGLILAYKA